MNKNIDLRRAVTRQLQSTRQREKEKASLELPDFEKRARQVVKAKFWSTCEVIMTVYALSADDFRLMCTNAPADPVFDVFTGLSLSFFLADMLLLSLATHDYFMGNMFLLDLISTLTLVLDFSFVEFGVDRRSVDNFRSARTARLGVRASRVAWNIRSTRIYKVCKPFFFPPEQEAKDRRGSNPRLTRKFSGVPGEDQPDEFPRRRASLGSAGASEEKFEGLMTESMVGRKLANLTVCRVIAVVLLMVVVLPLMQVDASSQLPTSVDYGSELVHEAFMKLLRNSSEQNKARYERTLLQFVYYHNWFVRHGTLGRGCPDDSRVCPANYYSSVFAFGLAGWGSSEGQDLTAILDLARIRRSSLEEFQASQKPNTVFDLGAMPYIAKTFLTSPWSTRCKHWDSGVSLIAQEIDSVVSFPVQCPDDLRSIEITKFTPRLLTNSELERWHIVFFSDDRLYVREAAGMNLISTAVICITLCIAAMFIFHDARTLILQPLESMMLKTQLIKINPLMAKEIANDALRAEWNQDASEMPKREISLEATDASILERLRRVARKRAQARKVVRQPLETRVLENTIVKLGMLLMLGFGEAGVNIVGRNMTCDDQEWVDGKVEARAWVNGMINGFVVECLIGVTRIGNFAVMTEVLQCHVMAFVNQIAEIVHGAVDAFHGAPNSVNGDEFLLVWTTADMEPAQKSKIADMAICAFVRISAAVHSSRTIAKYRSHPALVQRLGTHYRINVTSGLHHGWAIEGAIGTEFKIDASYVSQHVSVANAIQHATAVYGVSFLITGEVMKIASQEAAGLCRLIDRVTFHHEKRDLYSFDMHCDFIGIEPALTSKFTRAPFNAKQRFKYRQYLEMQKTRKWVSRWNITKFLIRGWGMEVMRTPYTVEFLQVFNMGLQNYFLGEWRCARRLLEHCRWLLGFEDGPSAALVDFMDSFKDGAPKNWQGVHALEGMQARAHTHNATTVNGGKLDMLDHLKEVGKQKPDTTHRKIKPVRKATVTTQATILLESKNLEQSHNVVKLLSENEPLIRPESFETSQDGPWQDSVSISLMSFRRPLQSCASLLFEDTEEPVPSVAAKHVGRIKIKRKLKTITKPKTSTDSSDVASTIGRRLECESYREAAIGLSSVNTDFDDSDKISSQSFESARSKPNQESFTPNESSTTGAVSSFDHTLLSTPRKKKIKYKRVQPERMQNHSTILEYDGPRTGSIFSCDQDESSALLS